MSNELKRTSSPDKYVVLYADEKGICHVAQLGVNVVHAPAMFIGVSILSELGENGMESAFTTRSIMDGSSFSDIYGKLLTLCDATMSDIEQRDAFKSMVKEIIGGWHEKNVNYAFKMTNKLLSESALQDA